MFTFVEPKFHAIDAASAKLTKQKLSKPSRKSEHSSEWVRVRLEKNVTTEDFIKKSE